jgi:hypothetical protein
MLVCKARLNHLGIDKTPARSTLSYTNTKKSYLVFDMLTQYHSFFADSRLKGLSIRNLKIINSTYIRLFCDILKGIGRNPLNESKKIEGIIVHAMMDALSGVVEFVRMTEA